MCVLLQNLKLTESNGWIQVVSDIQESTIYVLHTCHRLCNCWTQFWRIKLPENVY